MSMTWQCKGILSCLSRIIIHFYVPGVHIIIYIIRSNTFNVWHLYSHFSLTAGGFIDTTPGSDHYGKFRVRSEEVRQAIR